MKSKFFIIFLFFSISLFSDEIKYKADEMRVIFDENGEIEKILLSGNVLIFYKDITIKTEKGIYDRKSGEIECENGGEILSNMGEIRADYFKYNIVEEKGLIYNAKFKSEPFYGKGEKIERKGDFFIIENGYITTCELEKPHYRLGAGKIEFLKDNYIRVEKMKVIFGENFPVFYFPKYTIDLKTKKPFFSPSFNYKTRIGSTVILTFNHKVNEKKDYILSEDLLVGNKGYGAGFGFSSEKNNIEFDSLFFKRWEDETEKGGFLKFNKNFKNFSLLCDWRWMENRDFFVDFFKDEFLRKSKMYNYFSVQSEMGKGILGLSFREDAREEILNVEKLPELRYFLPYIQFSNVSFYFTYDFRFTNFYKEDENYFRVLNFFDFSYKKDFNYFTLKPFFSISFLNYFGNFDKFNYIGESGINFSTILSNNRVFFIPNFSFYSRIVNHKPENLINFDEFEEKNNGNFLKTNLRWETDSDTSLSLNLEIENEYDIGRNKFGNLFLKYEFGKGNFKIYGDNEFEIENERYEFGVNSLSYEKEKYKFEVGTRYEDESDIFGIEAWYQQKIKNDWQYRIGLFYDFDSKEILNQTYEVWKRVHCLTFDLRITKDRDNFSFYFFVFPSIFFENNWQRRYVKWK